MNAMSTATVHVEVPVEFATYADDGKAVVEMSPTTALALIHALDSYERAAAQGTAIVHGDYSATAFAQLRHDLGYIRLTALNQQISEPTPTYSPKHAEGASE